MSNRFVQILLGWLASRHVPIVLAVMAIVVMLPALGHGWFLDDMMFRARLVLLFLVVASRCTGQVATNAEFEGIAKRGIELVYDLEFERAEHEFSTLGRLQPTHPAGHFLLAIVDWWRILIDLEEERYDERFLGALDRVIEMCDSLLDHNENDVTAIFFKGGSIGFQGRLLFHRNDYLSAANAGRKALPLVQTALDLAPENHDLLLGAGMYNYYADVIPREYPFLKPLLLFIPPGDKKSGLQQLTLASEKATYAAVEATYFLMQVYYFYEKDYAKACTIALGLHGRFPNNMLFHRYLGRCYASLGNWEMAAQTFAEISARVRRGQRGYGVAADREAACTYVVGAPTLRSTS